MDQINWQEYLNQIYSVANIAIPATERVIVVETGYLKKLVQLLDGTPPRVLGIKMHGANINFKLKKTKKKQAH